MSAAIPPGDNTVRLVAATVAVAANSSNGAETSIFKPAQATPVNQPKQQIAIGPTDAEGVLDGLVVMIAKNAPRPSIAAIVRPNVPAHEYPYTMFPVDAQHIINAATIWHGPVSGLNDMRLAVKAGSGILYDAVGRIIWSGVIVDPSDYEVKYTLKSNKTATAAVYDARGHKLWSGPSTFGYGQPVDDGYLQMLDPKGNIVWQRAVGDARISLNETFDGQPAYSDTIQDGEATLRVNTATATLKSKDGALIWSGDGQVVTSTFQPANSKKIFTGFFGPIVQPLLPTFQINNAPQGCMISYTDASGKPIG